MFESTSLVFVIAHLFHALYFSFFYFLFPPLYPTSSLSFPFHTLTTNDKTSKHDDIGTIWPSNTWWPKELLDPMLSRPKNIQRSAPHRPLLNEVPHRIQQVTLRRSLPGSQCLLFPLELEVHPSQPPQTQRARLKDDDHVATTNRDGITI